jgi:hypothetical protein
MAGTGASWSSAATAVKPMPSQGPIELLAKPRAVVVPLVKVVSGEAAVIRNALPRLLADSPLEETGFELSVPPDRRGATFGVVKALDNRHRPVRRNDRPRLSPGRRKASVAERFLAQPQSAFRRRGTASFEADTL